MSSHHTQRFFNLHHEQVMAGRARRLERQAERISNFLAVRSRRRNEHKLTLVLGFVCFAYISIATSVYTGYVLGIASL